MKYELLNGEVLDLSELSRDDRDFLDALLQRSIDGENYFSLERAVCGAGAYPLKGSARVTRAIHESPLFIAAEDIVDRTGIRQGVLAPDPNDEAGRRVC